MEQSLVMNKTLEKIDFVVTYLDSTDKKWQEERAKYSGENLDSRNSEARYRNMDNFQYWFRAIERYAPWVNKIHLVTWGHVPEWLDTTNPKINIVKHDDYIPKEYLPTFNSNVLDLNLDRIPGLSENFVYFNDDIFLNSKTEPSDFFKNNLPLYQYMYTPVLPVDAFNSIIFNNSLTINQLPINKKFITKKSLSIKNGAKAVLFNIYLSPLIALLKRHIGFYPTHLARPLKREAFRELREYVSEPFDKTSQNKFRTHEDISILLLEDYLKITGRFYPCNIKKVGLYQEINDTVDYKKILESDIKLICFNDTDNTENFEKVKTQLNQALADKFSEKSSYEL